MDAKRITDLKFMYVFQLIAQLRTLQEAADLSEEHREAVRQVEQAMVNCLDYPPGPKSPTLN